GAYGFSAESAVHRMIDLLHDLRGLDGVAVTPPPDLEPVLEQSRAHMDAEYGPGAADWLVRTSVNVGTIQGGQKVNVVAEACTAQVDFRIPPGMTVGELSGRIDAIVRRHPRVTFQVRWANEPSVSSPEHPWFQ